MVASQRIARPAPGRRARLEARGQKRVIGSRLSYNRRLEQRYAADLLGLLGDQKKDYLTHIGRWLRARGQDSLFTLEEMAKGSREVSLRRLLGFLDEKWAGHYRDRLDGVVGNFLGDVDSWSQVRLEKSLAGATKNLTLRMPQMSERVETAMRSHVAANSKLIKGLGREFSEKVEGAVWRAFQQDGMGGKGILSEIRAVGKVSEKRALFIAAQQNAAATSQFFRERMLDVGVSKVRWRHSSVATNARKLHREYDGKIFDLLKDEPPWADEKHTRRAWPGEEPNCRCVFEPVVEW